MRKINVYKNVLLAGNLSLKSLHYRHAYILRVEIILKSIFFYIDIALNAEWQLKSE